MSETIIVAILTSGVLSTLLTQLIAWLKERKAKPTALDNALQWLLRDKLEFLMTRALAKGETTMHAKQFIHRGYNFYHELGGNGDIADLLHEFDSLQVKY